MIITWAEDDDAPARGIDLLDPFEEIPPELNTLLRDPDVTLVAHNAPFDMRIFLHALGYDIPVSRWFDTRACAYAHGLPGSLETLGVVLGLPQDQQKLVEDGKLIDFFCKPVKKTDKFNEPWDHAEKWKRFFNYALRDTEALRAIFRKLPKKNYRDENLRLWHLDQMINERGFQFDEKLAAAAVDFLKRAKKNTDESLVRATGGAVGAASQRARLLNYLQKKLGFEISNLRAAEIREWLEHDDLPLEVRFLLETRLEAGKSSSAKYGRGLRNVGARGRMRGTIQYGGAGRTGRFSGRGFQPHNMPRPLLAVRAADGSYSLAPVKAGFIDNVVIPGIYSGDALDNVIVYGGPNECGAMVLRHSIVAAPGNELVVADWKNIESRILAWVAGQEWKLEAYRLNDLGKGEDLYKLLFSQFFGLEIGEINDTERQSGKVCLAGSTMVLCKQGWKRLDSISIEDEVWDGERWCRHEGLVNNGLKSVVSLCGILLTPDHLVWSGQKWKRADILVVSSENTHCQMLEAGAENLPLQALSAAPNVELPESLSAAIAALTNTWSTRTVSKGSYLRDATHALKKPVGGNDTGNTPLLCRKTATGGAFLTGLRLRLRDALAQTTNSILRTAVGGLKFANSGARTGPLFWPMLEHCQAGMTQILNLIGRTWTEITRQEMCGSLRDVKIDKTNDLCVPLPQSEIVYDLKSVGSKHRFTVLSEKGPILVHNCELAFGFGGGVGALVTMAASYNMDLEPLAALVLPRAKPEHLRKAEKAWRRAFLTGEDYDLTPDVYMACDVLKQVYRASNDKINQFRYDIDNAVKGAIETPGRMFDVGRCKVWANEQWLFIELPSGRRLLYSQPRIVNEVIADPETKKPIHRSYITYSTARGKQWRREKAWGGLFVENIVQGIAADVLRHSLLAIHEDTLSVPEIRAYLNTLPEWERTAIAFHVHDEVILDVPAGTYPLKRLEAQMAKGFWWSVGLPLAAEGWTGYRYGKR